MTESKIDQAEGTRAARTGDIAMDMRREGETRRGEWERATILNGLSELVMYQDLEMRVVWANRAAAESVGLAPEDLVGRHCYEVRHGRSEPCTDCPVVKARDTGRPQSGEMVSAKGAVWLVQGVPIRDADGKVERLVDVALDITERRRAEAAARRRTHELGERFKELNCLRRLSNLLQNPGISLEETLRRTSALLRPAWQYPKTACGRIILEGREFATPNFRETQWRQSSDIVVHGERSGIVEVCYLEERPESDEGPFLKQERILIDAIAERLGRVVEHRRAEEALRTSEATYRSIFNATNDGILVLDMETGGIVDANATFCNVLGYAPQEARGLLVGDVSLGEAPYVQEDALRLIHLAAEGQPQRFEWLAKSRDGALLWIDVTLKRATIAGRDRVLAVGRDITQRKQADEALRASEATYRAIFNATNDSILVHDMETGEIVDANAAFLERHGCTLEQVRRLSVGVFSAGDPPYTQEDALRWVRRAADGQPQRFEWLSKGGQDGHIWIDVSLKRATIAGQDRVLSISRDITERKQTEEALRESEAKFRTLMETTAASVFIYRGTRPLYINAAMERLTGYTREEILARELWQLVHPDFQSLVRERSRARQQGEQAPSRYEFKIVTKSGAERWVDFTAGIIEFEGQPAAIGTFYDITERKRADAALRESEERYRLLAENATDVIWTTDLDLNFTYLSPSVGELLGTPPEQLIARRVEKILTPASLQVAAKALAEELAIDEREAPRTRTLEFESYRRDGSTVWVEAKTTFLRDADGRPVGILGVSRDITERKQAEEALREINQALQALIQASPLAIITVDPQGNVKTWNRAAERIFGWSEQEALGRPNPIIPEDYEKEFRANLGAVLRGNVISEAETRRRRKGGSLIDVSLSTAAMRNATGDVIGVMGVFADITEQKRTEEELQKAREELEARVDRQMEGGTTYGLTFRELTVLHLVAAGKADKEIGHKLGISPLTAHKHLGNILAKMGAASRTEAGVRALREGLLD